MSGPITEIVNIPIDQLLPAEWNYKLPATEEQLKKLSRSIKHDGSAGVLAVREVDGGYEVMDGNHRLQVIQEQGWEEVPCENFGIISKAEAITIARRRNWQWFPDDVIILSELIADVVIPEIPIVDLAQFMPDDEAELRAMADLAQDFDWDIDEHTEKNTKEYERNYIGITFAVPTKHAERFEDIRAMVTVEEDLGEKNEALLRGAVLIHLMDTWLEGREF